MLPKPHKVKQVGGGLINKAFEKNFNLVINLVRKGGEESKRTFYQYRCGQAGRKRCIWTPYFEEKKITILFYGSRNKLENLWL